MSVTSSSSLLENSSKDTIFNAPDSKMQNSHSHASGFQKQPNIQANAAIRPPVNIIDSKPRTRVIAVVNCIQSTFDVMPQQRQELFDVTRKLWGAKQPERRNPFIVRVLSAVVPGAHNRASIRTNDGTQSACSNKLSTESRMTKVCKSEDKRYYEHLARQEHELLKHIPQ